MIECRSWSCLVVMDFGSNIGVRARSWFEKSLAEGQTVRSVEKAKVAVLCKSTSGRSKCMSSE